MATENPTNFGARMTVEQYLNKEHAGNKHKRFDYAERSDKPGTYYFRASSINGDTGEEKVTMGYVPHELGAKLMNDEKVDNLFITTVLTEGYDEPMFMLCESRMKTLLTLD